MNALIPTLLQKIICNQMANPENIHTNSMIWTRQDIFRNLCVCVCLRDREIMFAVIIREKGS